MGFTEVLTVVFVVLKCLGYLHWPWWQVFIPEYIGIGFWLLIVAGAACGVSVFSRRSKRRVGHE